MTLISDKTGLVLERAKKARTNFREFCQFIGGIQIARHQKKWIDELQAIGDQPFGKKVLFIAPPGAGKTTIMVLFTAWMIGRYPEEHIGYFSYADQVAWERSRAVRNIIEFSKPYHYVFPHIQPNKSSWGVESFQIQRNKIGDPHPTLRAGGATSAVVAYRINGLVIDDAHDPKNSANPAQREKVIRNYDDAIATRLTAKQWQVVIGTRWADTDLIGNLARRRGWKVVHIQALRKTAEGLSSYWEEQYPLEFLEAKRYESPATFAMQYMGDTSGGESGIITKLHRFYQDPIKFVEENNLVLAAGWDTAMKRGEENDFSVGYIGGLDKYGRIYILARQKGRYSLQELMDTIAQDYEDWGLFSIWIEDTASGTPAVDQLMAQMPHLPTVLVKPTSGGKASRVHALAPLLHGGHVLFYGNADWFADCEYNLIHFPYTDHDDDPDALFVLVNNLLTIQHPDAYVNRPEVRMDMR